MSEDNQKRKITKTKVKPHERSNPKSPGKHRVKGHTRKITKKVKDAVNKVTLGRKVGGSRDSGESLSLNEIERQVKSGDMDYDDLTSGAIYEVGRGFANGSFGTGWMAEEPYKELADYDEVDVFSDDPFDASARAWTETLQYEQNVMNPLMDIAKEVVKQEEGLGEEEIEVDDYLGTFSDLESEYLVGYSDYLRGNYLDSLRENKDELTDSDIETSLEALDGMPEYALSDEEKSEARQILYEAQGKDLSDLPVQERRKALGKENSEKPLTEF